MDRLDEVFQLPALGVLNIFMMGDTVLCEPIARELGIETGSFVVSNYPELFAGHPVVHGVRSFQELPHNARIIDITKAIKSMEGKGDDKHVVPGKFERMCREAGFQRALDKPQLYLTSAEMGSVQAIRGVLPGRTNVGVVLGSAHVAKNWVYMVAGIRSLAKAGYNVFVFSDKLNKAADWSLPSGIYHVIGKSLREMMQWIAAMDVMMGVDTGPMHVGGSLGVPLAVICFNVFADLYEIYDNVRILTSDNFTLSEGIKGVPIKAMTSAVAELAGKKKRERPVIQVSETPIMKASKHAYIRIRGIGDVALSLPAIATAQSLNGNSEHHYTYITGHAGAVLLKCTDMFDEVIEVTYPHATSGFPLPPPGIDYSQWDTVENMINLVDFIPHSDSVERTELFARAIGLDRCDYNAPGWKLTAPEEWKAEAWAILNEHGITEDDKFLIFQVDTAGLSRIYPKARQVEFCGLAMKHGWKVVLISDKIRRKYPKGCVNITGALSMAQYYGMIAIAKMGLSPDSALLHIAGAMDVPAVGLFGSVDPDLRIAHYETIKALVGKAKYCMKGKTFTPCNDWQKRSCSGRKHSPQCMWNITPKEVLSAVEQLYRETTGA